MDIKLQLSSDIYYNNLSYEMMKSIDTYDISIFNKTIKKYSNLNRLNWIQLLSILKTKKNMFQNQLKNNNIYKMCICIFVLILSSVVFTYFINKYIFDKYIYQHTFSLRNSNIENIYRLNKNPILLFFNNMCVFIYFAVLINFIIYVIKIINNKYPFYIFTQNKVLIINKMIKLVDDKIDDKINEQF